MKSVVTWLLRRAALYAVLVLAVAFGPPLVRTILGADLRGELKSPRQVVSDFERLQSEAVDAFERTQNEVAVYPASKVKERLPAAQAELGEVSRELGEKPGWFASMRPRAILERKELQLRQKALEGEIRLLEAAIDRHALRAELRGVLATTQAGIADARRRCEAANAEVRRFNRRYPLDRTVRNLVDDEAQQLAAAARTHCAIYRKQAEAALATVRGMQASLTAAQRAYATAGDEAQAAIAGVQINLVRTLQPVLLKAALLLAVIIATPYLIRLIFYFVLAPVAARRPAVRLRWPAEAALAPPVLPQASATSAAIRLDEGEELLVRQGFLQSTSSAGAKATRALLDWRHPLSSFASGLAFLTRIEGAGETTTVSAVHDPFAEVAVLTLAPGAACVLQPRALVAVVQPAGRPVRITSHWRLGSLHAWLTLQLRYLMFHGPARLVIKGGRGVRVEPVERGRVFGQDQLVGFSADLAYSVTRTQTFWPYFLGMEQLLKDRVEAGEGVLIVEETPMAGGRAQPRKGLEGAADVMLKAVGL